MTSTTTHKARARLLKLAAEIIFWAGLWELAALAVNNEVLFASPAEVFSCLSELFPTADFWKSILGSLIRISSGFIAGILAGALLAVLSSALKGKDIFVSPLITVIKSTPVASFIIVFWYWFEAESIPAIISFLMVLPIACSNISEGIKNASPQLLEMARFFKVPLSGRLKGIYLPEIKPYFSAAVTVSLGLAWKAGVAAEVLCHPSGAIGSKLYNAKVYFETDDLFAWTLIVIILSLIIENVLKFILSRLFRQGRRVKN